MFGDHRKDRSVGGDEHREKWNKKKEKKEHNSDRALRRAEHLIRLKIIIFSFQKKGTRVNEDDLKALLFLNSNG